MLVAAAAAAAHLAVAMRSDRFVATVGEARLAAATFAARGADLGDIALPAADRFAVRQFAVVQTLLPTGGVPVVDAARYAALAFGFLSVVLLWPVLRALGAGPVPAAVAAGLIGVVPPVVALHAGITAAAPADGVARRGGGAGRAARRRVAPAAVVAGLAALTAPLAAAALLALAAHLAPRPGAGRPAAARGPAPGRRGHGRDGGRGGGRGRRATARWRAIGGPVVGLGHADGRRRRAGIVLAWLAWTQHPELRPALTPAVLLLAVAVVPGAARSAALLLVLPFLAVVFALLAEPVVAALPERRTAVQAVPVTALALATVGLLAVVNTAPAPPTEPGRLGGQRARARNRDPARGPAGPRRAAPRAASPPNACATSASRPGPAIC